MKKIIFLIILFLNNDLLIAQNQDTVNVLRRSIDTMPVDVVIDTMPRKERKFLGGIFSNNDSTGKRKDTFFLQKKEFTPRGAALRSLILPGWGQAYNKQYWKIPIAMAGVGIPIGLYVSNKNYLDELQKTLDVIWAIKRNIADTVLISTLDPGIRQSYYAAIKNPAGFAGFHTNILNENKRFFVYKDYSLLWVIAMWALNVADATAFAHLKDFDVSDDISMKVEPTYFISTKNYGIKIIIVRK